MGEKVFIINLVIDNSMAATKKLNVSDWKYTFVLDQELCYVYFKSGSICKMYNIYQLVRALFLD